MTSSTLVGVGPKHKVLVTGAGLLGVAAIEKFLSAGWNVA
jgi:nucleoside-diphosphate-sugar epimerase